MSRLRTGVCLLALLIASTSCGSKHLTVRKDGPAGRVEGTLGVAPAILLKEVPGAVENDPFTDSLHVGHLHLSGGYIVVETERGMQHRSKDVEPSAEGSYAEDAAYWLDSAVSEIVASRSGIEARQIAAVPPEALEAPTRRNERGSASDDGTDNISLPRFELYPGELDIAKVPSLPDDVEHILVPIIVHYYSHNGGWFVGQTYGSGGGARVRVLWVAYDAETGRPVRWGEVSAREITRRMSPSRAEIEDYLIEIEKRGRRGLRRSLLR